MAVDLKAGLAKKIGPLPAWGWAVAIGGGLLVWKFAKGGGGGGSSSVIGGGGDADTPTGVNPGASGDGAFSVIPTPGTIGGSVSPLPIPIENPINRGINPEEGWNLGGTRSGPIAGPYIPSPNVGPIAPLGNLTNIVRVPKSFGGIDGANIKRVPKAVQTSVERRGTAAMNAGDPLATMKPINRASKAATSVVKQATAAAARRPSGDTVVAIPTKAVAKAASAAKAAPKMARKRATSVKPKVPAPKAVSASVQRRGARVL
jgi:hypothetical protein